MELRPRRSLMKSVDFYEKLHQPRYRGNQTPQEEFEAKKRQIPAGVRNTLSSYMISPTGRSAKLVLLRNLTARAPMILDVIEMSLNFFICGKQIMLKCKNKIDAGCILSLAMPALLNLLSASWLKVAGAILPDTTIEGLKWVFSSTLGAGLKRVHWKELVNSLITAFQTVDKLVAVLLPFPHLILKSVYNMLKLVVLQDGETFYDAAKQFMQGLDASGAWAKANKSETWTSETSRSAYFDQYKSLQDVCIALFGSFLFKDATLYLERYRATLESVKKDQEWVKKYIWAAFYVRIFCRNESNACTSASIMLSLPGFWALFDRRHRLMKLANMAYNGKGPSMDHPCFKITFN